MRLLIFLVLFTLLSGCTSGLEQNNLQGYGQSISDENNIYSKEISKNIANEKNSDKKIEANPDKKYQEVKVKNKKILDVPLIKQNPELKYGCEITSLTMVLQYAGFKVDKMQLAKEMPKDYDRLVKSNSGNILKWGDPNDGFVGDVTGKNAGYAIYDKPLEKIMRKFLAGRTINLTGKPFDQLLKQVENGKPVIVWTTGDYRLPDRWESWQHGNEQIKTPLDLHAVVLVGYDDNNIYINDPLSGKKTYKVNKNIFIQSWRALKMRALSYR